MLRKILEAITLLTALLGAVPSATAIDDIGPTNRVWLQGTSETVSRGFQNAGTLLFETIDDAYNISLYVPDGAITNLATGLIQFKGGAGGARDCNCN